jgi:hypothetical protein
MKIIAMNDCDWWIGESLEACVTDYQTNIDGDPIYTEDACELTDEDLDRLKFSEFDGTPSRTFREQLAIEIATGGKFPRMFASTEC